MKYLIPLILPFLIMVVVNEYSRPGLTGFHNAKYNATGMNPNVPMKDKCTWTGFFDTGYCKQHHVKHMSSLYEYIDPIYFGIISLLHATGNYGAGNIIFLVILWPGLMYYLLIRVIQLRKQLHNG